MEEEQENFMTRIAISSASVLYVLKGGIVQTSQKILEFCDILVNLVPFGVNLAPSKTSLSTVMVLVEEMPAAR